MASRFSVETVFKAVDRITAPVSKIQNRVGKFTRKVSRGFEGINKRVDKLSTKLKKFGVIAAASLAVTSTALGGVVTTGAQFEQTLVNAAAKFPGEIRKGTEEFDKLREAARETGATTEFSASQSAEALNFLAMAGFNAESSIAALPGVVDLATAAQIELAEATDIASDSLGAFGLATKDPIKLGKNLARVNDVLAKTTTSANTTMQDLFEAIKEGAPVATTAGASIETFAALAGELANSGIKASRAGTTLKNMFLKLSAPTGDAAKILNRLGIQTADADGNMRDIVEVLGELNSSLDGLGTAERSGVLEGIFGKIPIAGVNILLQSGSQRLNEYREQLEAASGASTRMADVMRDTVQGRLNSLQSAIEGVKIAIFEMNEGPLAEVIDQMTEWVRANEGLIAQDIGGFLAGLINNFEEIVSTGKKIAIVVGVFLALSAVLKTFIGIMTAVNLVMAANPIGLIVLGVMALIGAIAAAIIWWDDLKQAFSEAFTIGVGTDAAIAPFKNPGSFFGFGGGDEEPPEAETEVASPQDRTARLIEERKETSTAEVTIKDETGRSEVTGGRLTNNIVLIGTGAF